MTNIHKTAIIEKGADIANSAIIGPYCTIGKDVKIGNNSILKSHIIIEGSTIIGENNLIYPFSTIGTNPQDLKFNNEDSRLIIGNNNTIREHVTIHKGTKDGIMETRIGNNCLLMVGVHIAHDCIINNNVILANNATLAGHVEIQDNVIIGGLSAIHQFVKIGKGAMIGGMSGIEGDIIPYGLAMGERASLSGLNLVGLKRSKISKDQINNLRHFFNELYSDNSISIKDRILSIGKKYDDNMVNSIIDFINNESSRGLLKYKKS